MKLADNMTTGTVSGFAFSAVRPETLGATEYTLATLILDKTGSVSPFADALFEVKKKVVAACKKSARSDFVLLRVLEFNTQPDEVHGFLPLSQVDADAYTTPHCTGLTALRDATFSGLAATNAFAKTLTAQDYLVNGLVIVCTDGDDNRSRMSNADVKAQIKLATQGESMESLKTILVAVNAADCAAQLKEFSDEVGFDEYEDIGNATPQSLAKLADFVSRSLSATSQALGTGGPSQAIVF